MSPATRPTFILIAAALLWLLFLPPQAAHAHANLAESQPAPNTRLEAAPADIRLRFTEPLEPAFSRITLRDSAGQTVDVPAAALDPADPYVLVSGAIPALDAGVYTVVWSVVSAADGHYTRGSYGFSVGTEMDVATSLSPTPTPIPLADTLVRGLNLAGLTLLLGVLAFRVWVAKPISGDRPVIEHRLIRLHRGAWLLAGVGLMGMLLLQLRLIAGDDATLGAQLALLPGTLTGTRFGGLFLARAALWLALAALIWWGLTSWRARLALVLTAGMLLTQSLFSHASAAPDAAAVAADWLHLLAAGTWLGGLVAFIVVLGVPLPDSTRIASALTARFSNLARASVLLLAISGAYSAWLHVGSLDALTGTQYGLSLLVKLALFVPLLGIAAVNLLLTARALRRGEDVWVGRLRGLIGVELALLAGTLLAVGAMTSLQPARAELSALRTQMVAAEPAPYFEMQVAPDGVMAHLEVEPGWAGENEFIVTLFDERGAAVEDASLLRLRFENPGQGISESNLRLEPVDRGTYRASGANLSASGDWQVRMTVRRPGAFDTVLDFSPTVTTQPLPRLVQPDDAPDAAGRFATAALAGLALAGAGGGLIAPALMRRPMGGFRLTAGGLALFTGLLFIVTAAGLWSPAPAAGVTAESGWALPARAGANSSVYVVVRNADTADRVLTNASSEAAARVSLHSTSMSADGVAAMMQVNEIRIPAGEAFAFAPGESHLMLEQVARQLSPGDEIVLTLSFDDGTQATVPVLITLEPPF
ncbi:MAG: copper chaperone PCu(A)C [Pleurocapsa minor GSE-CHR-MK-17-07R]|jgi:copper transport protein|nr:copper chaperone PCu(A)C [Pleurocapsa minor GSE-CHR-MK 17-07R]